MASVNWLNSDGLYIRLGTNEVTPVTVGEAVVYGPQHVTELVLTYTQLAAFGTTVILSNDGALPIGAIIEEVDILVETAFAGATATLSIGLVSQLDRTTVTGLGTTTLVNAMAVATLSAGAYLKLVVGSTSVGTLVGANTTVGLPLAGLITATAGTATFTGGVAKIRIFWSMALPTTN